MLTPKTKKLPLSLLVSHHISSSLVNLPIVGVCDQSCSNRNRGRKHTSLQDYANPPSSPATEGPLAISRNEGECREDYRRPLSSLFVTTEGHNPPSLYLLRAQIYQNTCMLLFSISLSLSLLFNIFVFNCIFFPYVLDF